MKSKFEKRALTGEFRFSSFEFQLFESIGNGKV